MFKKNLPIVLLFITILSAGCITTQSETTKARLEAVEKKKKDFDALYTSASANTLQKGLSTADVRETYGRPDDVYSSGSSDSRFEMWTYERVVEKGEEDWQPIRLYFNNGKLVSWKY